MRILQVAGCSRRRGAEVFAYQLGAELAARGHQITTVALEHRINDSGLPFSELKAEGRGPRAIAELASRARSHDVLISHGGSPLLTVTAAAKLARRPFVYRNIGDPSFWGRSRGAQLRIGVPIRAANHIVALYPGAAHYMNTRYRADPERMTVAPNAVDVARFSAVTPTQRRAERSELGLSSSQLVLGYLGNLSDEKRPDWAIDAVEAIDVATLLIAGDGPLRESLADRVRSLGNRRGMPTGRLLGTVNDAQRFLAAIDVLLLPSATEGIPGVLVEAALVGIPVVCTDVGGVRDTMTAMSAGVCVPPDNANDFVAAVRSVIHDLEKHQPNRVAAIDHHSIGVLADQWEQLLLRAVG
jgi:glycosyltransferase involved in cell wall biosynthesis